MFSPLGSLGSLQANFFFFFLRVGCGGGFLLYAGNQISFEDLSAEEKKHFQRAVASGELSKLIKPWEPWWSKPSAKYISLGQDGTQLVQPLVKEDTAVSSEDRIGSDPLHDIPLGPDSPLPSVRKLSAAGHPLYWLFTLLTSCTVIALLFASTMVTGNQIP